MTHLYSLICLSLGAVCYCISQLSIQGKMEGRDATTFGFWTSHSWMRKYKYDNDFPHPAPDNWYYRMFDISYKERFPGSATILVSLTDSYHFFQMLFLLLISAAMAILTDNWFFWFLIFRGSFGIVFTVGYKLFAR
jgi:hypothetical protein